MATTKFQGNLVATVGDLPKIGSKAPDFHLVDIELKGVRLADYPDKKKILNIVPSLDTPICATSTKKFNDLAKTRPDIAVLTISADLPFAQNRFCAAENIQNVKTLSMMRDRRFAQEYGVLMPEGPLAGICARSIVVLDEHDEVLYTELVPEIFQEPDYEAAIAAVS
jgi:thiol peroxidase